MSEVVSEPKKCDPLAAIGAVLEGRRDCCIVHGDCLEILPLIADGAIDAVVTDPPYSSGGFTRSDRAASTTSKYVQTGTMIQRRDFSGDNRSQRGWQYWCALWLSQCHRLVRPSGYALMFTDWRQLPCAADALEAGGFVHRGVITWDKGLASRAPHTGYFRHQAEFVVWGTSGVSAAASHGGPWPGVIPCPVRQADKHHITGKPTELMRRLVQCVPPGGVILDPFAGSGTTAVAARLEGRRCIAIDIDGRNCEIAKNRLASVSPPLLEQTQ